MKLIEGKLVSEKIKEYLKKQVVKLIDKDMYPHLAEILVEKKYKKNTFIH
jgi:5,10-methylene-tetrahydrofolate dehydrogenase/methenyl tetrahydrofolate cyclohydrolase